MPPTAEVQVPSLQPLRSWEAFLYSHVFSLSFFIPKMVHVCVQRWGGGREVLPASAVGLL